MNFTAENKTPAPANGFSRLIRPSDLARVGAAWVICISPFHYFAMKKEASLIMGTD